MTEDEAKTKWCPFVRLAAPLDSEASGTAGNRFGNDISGNFRCIASACMAWRTMAEPHDGNRFQVVAPLEGFCGLAGSPA